MPTNAFGVTWARSDGARAYTRRGGTIRICWGPVAVVIVSAVSLIAAMVPRTGVSVGLAAAAPDALAESTGAGASVDVESVAGTSVFAQAVVAAMTTTLSDNRRRYRRGRSVVIERGMRVHRDRVDFQAASRCPCKLLTVRYSLRAAFPPAPNHRNPSITNRS